MRTRHPDGCESVGSGVDAKLLGDSGENFERVLCLVTITLVVGESVKAEQRDGSGGIAGGSRRILERLAASLERTERGGGGLRCVEEAARGFVIEESNHDVCDLLGETE